MYTLVLTMAQSPFEGSGHPRGCTLCVRGYDYTILKVVEDWNLITWDLADHLALEVFRFLAV